MARRARFFAINPNKKNVNQDYDEPLLPPDSPQMTELSVNNDISRSFPARYRKEGNLLVSLYDDVKDRRNHDQRIAIRNILMLVNVIAGLCLMIIMLYEAWDGHHLVATEASRIIKIIVSVLTGILILQILECTRIKLLDKTAQIRKRRHVHRQKKSAWFGFYNSNPTWFVVLRNSSLRWKVLLEILVCIPHPFPGLGVHFVKVGSLLMFLRLYIGFYVIRDLSPIYTHRWHVRRIPGYTRNLIPSFSTWMSLRMFFYRYPIPFLLVGMAYLIGTTSFGIYIYERESQSDFTYPFAVYVSLLSMLIGWPDDVYERLNLTTWGSQIIAIIASVFGLFLFALLIDYAHTQVHLTSTDASVVDWITRLQLEEREKEEAARLIQLVWRNYRRRKAKRQPWPTKRVRGLPRNKTYQVLFVKQVKRMQDVQRDLNDIQGKTGTSLANNNSQSAESPHPTGGTNKQSQQFYAKLRKIELLRKQGRVVSDSELPHATSMGFGSVGILDSDVESNFFPPTTTTTTTTTTRARHLSDEEMNGTPSIAMGKSHHHQLPGGEEEVERMVSKMMASLHRQLMAQTAEILEAYKVRLLHDIKRMQEGQPPSEPLISAST